MELATLVAEAAHADASDIHLEPGAPMAWRVRGELGARGAPIESVDTEAMARDNNGRLRRESWLASKARCFLNRALQIHLAYRNYVRRRFNYDPRSSAEWLGICDRRLRPTELLAWRQDWGRKSIHTTARRNESVAEVL